MATYHKFSNFSKILLLISFYFNIIITIGFLCLLFFQLKIFFTTSSLQATIWKNKSRGLSISVGTGSFSWLIIVNELNILQTNSSAWIIWTAIELYSNFRCRCSMNILIYHITDFNPWNLLNKGTKKFIELNFIPINVQIITFTNLW